MMPCDDEILISNVGDTSAHHHEEHGHGHKHGSDHCSPFCVCAVTNVVEIEFDFTDNFTETVFETPRFFYLAPLSTVYASTVFQPPKA
jgi:hypothetical protein